LNFAGIDDVVTVWYQRYKMISDDEATAAMEKAQEEARAAARRQIQHSPEVINLLTASGK